MRRRCLLAGARFLRFFHPESFRRFGFNKTAKNRWHGGLKHNLVYQSENAARCRGRRARTEVAGALTLHLLFSSSVCGGFIQTKRSRTTSATLAMDAEASSIVNAFCWAGWHQILFLFECGGRRRAGCWVRLKASLRTSIPTFRLLLRANWPRELSEPNREGWGFAWLGDWLHRLLLAAAAALVGPSAASRRRRREHHRRGRWHLRREPF